MTPEPDAVGARMAQIFEADEPRLEPEAVEPIRALLREGDWASAAQYAAKVLDSLGIDVRASSEGVGTDSGTRNSTGKRTADSVVGDHEQGDMTWRSE
jgi:hypothetical protein